MSHFSGDLSAAVITYYRFEVDNDPDPLGLETPNEISGQPSLKSISAAIDMSTNAGSLPNLFVPSSGQSNSGSLDGLSSGTGNPDINATAAYTNTLDVDEMTVELFVRSEEQDGVLVGRSSSNNIASSIADGFRIYDPDDLKVEFYTEDTMGNVGLNTISTTYGLDDSDDPNNVRGDGNAAWRHIAFSYDKTSGIGVLYIDGVAVESVSAGAESVLYWGESDPELQVGVNLDGYNFSKTADDNGYIDELRISSEDISATEFLSSPTDVPEPSSILLAFLAMFPAFFIRNRKPVS
ncbi:MAG: LamG-like jellyroll fold domain-containing protein [Akkermansiaceae bacterium]